MHFGGGAGAQFRPSAGLQISIKSVKNLGSVENKKAPDFSGAFGVRRT